MDNPDVELSGDTTAGGVAGALTDPDGDLPAAAAARTASAFYDADRPPFEELPEQPKRPPPPAAVAAAADQAGGPASRPLLAGAVAFAALVALVVLRRRRRRCGAGGARGRGRGD